MAKRIKTVAEKRTRMTQSEFDHRMHGLEELRTRLSQAHEERRIVALDGTDDENPAYAQVQDTIRSIEIQISQAESALQNVDIIKATEVDNNVINEFVKSITLRCVYPDETCECEFIVGHELGNLTPQSPLFQFLLGKTIGYSGKFINKIPFGETISYEVTILDFKK